MTLKRGAAWYLRRLQLMGPAEVVHRVAEQARVQGLRVRHLGRSLGLQPAARPASTPAFCRSSTPCLPPLPWGPGPDPAARDRLLAGHRLALGAPWQWRPGPAAWHQAPDTGRDWPRRFFADIPYRAGNPWGDIRVAWEPARLQQLVDLALLAGTPGGERGVTLLEDQLLSFVAHNPPYAGIHYVSAMECALRIIAVCHALDGVRTRLTRPGPVWDAALALVASHGPLIEKRLSLHSSAGNHTVAEGAGLLYAGELFPEFPAARRWRQTGLALLEQELDRQVLPDGGGLEQAFWYLRFVVDLGNLACRLLDHRGSPPPARLAAAAARGTAFLAALAGPDGELPHVGDRDDGFALSGRLQFFQPEAGGAASRTFADSGYTLLRDPGSGLRVLFDHGPLGMPPAFGHGHGDPLAVTAWQGSRPLLLDPGTCTYTGDPGLRRYFRSARAHNTVTVDGRDPAVQEAPFLWSAPYRCEGLGSREAAGGTRVLARHDGYGAAPGVRHWRGVQLGRDGLLVWDRVEAVRPDAAPGLLELRWHCGEPLVPAGEGFALGAGLALVVAGADAVTCAPGDERPPVGWHSPAYGRLERAWILTGTAKAGWPREFVTWLGPRAAAPSPAGLAEQVDHFRQWVRECRAG